MSHNDDSFPSVVNASSTPGREYPLLRTNDNELPNNFFTEALKVFHKITQDVTYNNVENQEITEFLQSKLAEFVEHYTEEYHKAEFEVAEVIISNELSMSPEKPPIAQDVMHQVSTSPSTMYELETNAVSALVHFK